MNLDEDTRWKLVLLTSAVVMAIAAMVIACIVDYDFRKEVIDTIKRPHEIMMGAIHLAFMNYKREQKRKRRIHHDNHRAVV